jgi:membrane protein DedA with SNARE-associated domain
MSGMGLKDSLLTLVRDNLFVAEPAVFAMGFAEGIPGLSLLVPSSALFIGIGAVHGAAGGDFWTLWVPASIGAFAGDCVVYLLARHYKDGIIRLQLFRRYPDWPQRGHAIFERWGALAVLGGKFLGFMRPFIPAIAGTLDMRASLFLPASLVASMLWAAVFLAPGYGISWLFS